MARKTTALEIERKRCVHACVRAETTGERAAKMVLVALQRREQGEKDGLHVRVGVCGRIAGCGDIATDQGAKPSDIQPVRKHKAMG